MSDDSVVPGGCAYSLRLSFSDGAGGVDYSHHCTLMYVGKHLSHYTHGLLLEVGHKVASENAASLRNFRLQVYNVGHYGNNDLAVEVVKCPTLKRLRADLEKLLKSEGIEWSDVYPGFRPHVTLGTTRRVPERLSVECLEVKLGKIWVSL